LFTFPAIIQLREKFREAVALQEFTSDTSKGVDERLKALEAFKTSFSPEEQKQGRRGGLSSSKKCAIRSVKKNVKTTSNAMSSNK
jgi:hypothetical protein